MRFSLAIVLCTVSYCMPPGKTKNSRPTFGTGDILRYHPSWRKIRPLASRAITRGRFVTGAEPVGCYSLSLSAALRSPFACAHVCRDPTVRGSLKAGFTGYYSSSKVCSLSDCLHYKRGRAALSSPRNTNWRARRRAGEKDVCFREKYTRAVPPARAEKSETRS